ncbi:hypothetical protein EGW08_004417 [Elysia chlorotica]|uniref:Uncharacterized protein n=1 Tax=Elysia chlorotica TaxID=188477 RepID=A0A3S1ABU6_ELYCH|nr:hypothetical protein EGW08_004417 [Elysia chlorotica]
MSRGKVSPSPPYPDQVQRTYTVTAQRTSNQWGEPVFTVCVVPAHSVLSTLSTIAAASRSLQEESHASSLENPGFITTLVDIHADFSGAEVRSEATCQPKRPSANGDARDSLIYDHSSGNSASPYSYIAPCQSKKVDLGNEYSKLAKRSVLEAEPGAHPTSSVDAEGSSHCAAGWGSDAPTMEIRPRYDKRPVTIPSLRDKRHVTERETVHRQASPQISFLNPAETKGSSHCAAGWGSDAPTMEIRPRYDKRPVTIPSLRDKRHVTGRENFLMPALSGRGNVAERINKGKKSKAGSMKPGNGRRGLKSLRFPPQHRMLRHFQVSRYFRFLVVARNRLWALWRPG